MGTTTAQDRGDRVTHTGVELLMTLIRARNETSGMALLHSSKGKAAFYGFKLDEGKGKERQSGYVGRWGRWW